MKEFLFTYRIVENYHSRVIVASDFFKASHFIASVVLSIVEENKAIIQDGGFQIISLISL